MNSSSERLLRWAVISWAGMGLIGIPVLVLLDPFGGWRWQPQNAIYEQMIVAIYFAVGVSALRAVRRPLEHRSFLWFLVISSLTHGGVMFFHAVLDPEHRGHLVGDAWILAGGLALAVPLWQQRGVSSGKQG